MGIISSAERGTVTAICCCSATGRFIPPPGLIFPRKRLMEGLLAGAPPGTKAFCSESGWINTEIFNHWLHFFVERVRPTAHSPVLLIVDDHVSHKSIEALDYASENNVVILSVPPHTTHKLQPLDRCVFGPLKSAYEKTVTRTGKSVIQTCPSRCFK